MPGRGEQDRGDELDALGHRAGRGERDQRLVVAVGDPVDRPEAGEAARLGAPGPLQQLLACGAPDGRGQADSDVHARHPKASAAPARSSRRGAGRGRPDQDRVDPRVLVGGLVAHRHVRAHDRDRLLLLHPDHAAAGAGHADVGDVGRPAGEHAGVVGRDVGVRADDRGHLAVQVPAERDLLARDLGVHVDEDVVAAGDLAQRLVDGDERGRARLQVHDAAAGSRRPATRRRARRSSSRGPAACAGSCTAARSGAPPRDTARPRGGDRCGCRA